MAQTILLVEDEPDIVELVIYNLEKSGFLVKVAMSGEEGLKYIKTVNPDLVLLDIMLPGIQGIEICRILKNDPKYQNIPIIFLTAKSDESDIVKGLEYGADDYLPKPFSPKVLVARINAVLRRKKALGVNEDKNLDLGFIQIDKNRHQVMLEGQILELTATEFNLLYFLANNRGFVFTRDQIVDSIKGEDYPVTDRSVDVQVVGLRKKLGKWGDIIETVRGVGYKFKEDFGAEVKVENL